MPRGLSGGCSQEAGWRYNHLEARQHLEDPLLRWLTHVAVGRKRLSTLPVCLSTELLEWLLDTTSGFLQLLNEWLTEQGRRHDSFQPGLRSHMMCYFCHILFVRSNSLKLQPPLLRRRLRFHLSDRRVLKNLWLF